ncbi:MAG: CocE/NonD family hydrolase [Sphingomicrobium sp.]
MMRTWLWSAAALAIAVSAVPAAAQDYNETPATVIAAVPGSNYQRRLVEIPMRDGVTLHTVILVPNGARGAPILLTRTPYDANGLTNNVHSGNLMAALDGYDNAADITVEGGYIRVVQDVRGKYGSQGTYVMNRPMVGNPLNPTKVDDGTDAYDTIDWLAKNVPESNGRIGVIGISYDGYEALVPLINPHPALKVVVPMNPMVDGWRGDDWFHNGAFRQTGTDYIFEQEASRDNSATFSYTNYDVYDAFMRAGSAGEFGRQHGLDQVGFWRQITQHPAYDSFWQSQAMDLILGAQPLTVPVMLVDSLWDAEDIYGALAVYRAIEPKDSANDRVFLTLGPWYHGQGIDQGRNTGAIQWDQDTSKAWRHDVLAPFLAHYLKDTPMDVAPVTAFQSGTNRWQRLTAWPTARASERLFLRPDMSVGFDAAGGPARTANYWSDPAHPVTNTPRPNRTVTYEDDHWKAWLTTDQRNVSTRPDVLTFTGPVLTAPLTIAGVPVVHLNASTSGSDSDWVVKLIDVYPDEVAGDRAMSGYQFPIAMDIFRGRYRESMSQPKALKPNVALGYNFDLPATNHVFLPGHRLMVQVQSSWFPLYDRNPQTFVPNIFYAKPADYVVTQQKVVVGGPQESFIELPVVR